MTRTRGMGEMMGILVSVVGGLTILYSPLHFAAAKSAMHETTAAVLWVGGWIMLALGAGLDRLRKTDATVRNTQADTDAVPEQVRGQERRLAGNLPIMGLVVLICATVPACMAIVQFTAKTGIAVGGQ